MRCQARRAAGRWVLVTTTLLLSWGGSSVALAQDAGNPPPPPCAGEAFRAFDFWVGDWQVHTGDGKVAGANSITLRERDCVLLEQWTGAQGGTGMSMNFYEPVSDRWRQVWHSAYGVLIDIAGGWDGESMVLTGTIEYVANGTRQPFRGTWTPLEDGRVRQFFEQSSDEGESWQPWFEGFYTRRGEEQGSSRQGAPPGSQ